MKAQIDIITPSGIKLENFPMDFDQNEVDFDLWENQLDITHIGAGRSAIHLHKGDIITIEVLETKH